MERHFVFRSVNISLIAIFILFCISNNTYGQGQLLGDPGFELSIANGSFPNSGYWNNSDAGGGADAGCTTTASHSGSNGLWEYTGYESWAWWSGPYQEFSSSQGKVYRASAWIRTPSIEAGGNWVSGSKASIRVLFLNSNKGLIIANESAGVSTIGLGWAEYNMISGYAPAGTAYVRFLCYITKPEGTTGVSVANFDDCYFEEIPTPPLTPMLYSPSNGAVNVSLNPTLIWNTSGGALSYHLQVSTNSVFSTTLIDQTDITATSKQITGLTNNTLYYWRISAVNSSGTSAWSEVWSFTTIIPPPLPPVLSSPVNGSVAVPVNPTLIWNSSSGAVSYRLQVSIYSNFSTTFIDESNITVTSKQVSELTNNTPYYWRVNAVNPSGVSEWSEGWSFTTVVSQLTSPELNPLPGTYNTSQDIEIISSVTGALVRYTIDGSEPTDKSAIYTGPIHINSQTTIKACAFNTGWIPSNITTGTYSFIYPSSVKAAIEYLSDVMDQYHRRFYVYEDISSAGNHFHALAKMPDSSAAIRINGSYSSNTHSGATCCRFEYQNITEDNFGGIYFQNGVLPKDSLAPVPNFGEIPNAGINLSGAKSISFWAKGEKGGEKIQFFVAGVGRHAEWGFPIMPYPDSSPRHPEVGTIFTLTNEWQNFVIDLSGLNLSYVLGGFGWVADDENNPDGVIFYLDDIYYELDADTTFAHLNEPRFLRSFSTLPLQPDPDDDNVDEDIDFVLRNTAFTYDNAVALLAFLADSTVESLGRARLIGDAFMYASTHDRTYTDGRLRDAYAAGDISLPPGWTPNNISNTVPVPGFYNEDQTHFYEVENSGISVGNNAWAMLALLGLYKRTFDVQYLECAGRIGQFIKSFRNNGGLYQGFLGGLDNPESQTPSIRTWASSEHNIDVYAAFSLMHEITGEPDWLSDAQHAYKFVEDMWDSLGEYYLTGTLDNNNLNREEGKLPVDVQSWSILSLPNTIDHHPQIFSSVEYNHRLQHHNFSGFDFNNDKDGIWFEGTAHMVLSYYMYDNNIADDLAEELRIVQQTTPFGNGLGISAACHDGISTGFGFKLFRRLHVGATAWHIFAQLKFNPYYQQYVEEVIPVELLTFTASLEGNIVNLKWATATETNNKGFEIERSLTLSQKEGVSELRGEWVTCGFVKGKGTMTEVSNYSFVDDIQNVSPPTKNIKYRLKQIDFDGTYEYSNEIKVSAANPAGFSLEQNYPNPFNPVTTIKYSIPVETLHSTSLRTTLSIYDILGREVATLVNETKEAGTYEVEFDGSKLSSGIFFYKLSIGDLFQMKKMILLK